MPLKQNNASFDGKSLKNVIIPLYAQFKENVTPNLKNASLNQPQNSGLNIRKLSQATNIFHISNQSILQTIQSGTRPPAVPQSKTTSNKEVA